MNNRHSAERLQWNLAVVYALMVFARTSVVAVIPILALKYLGQVSDVSLLYLFASLFGLGFSFILPRFIMGTGIWYALITATCLGVVSSAMFVISSPYTLFFGLLCHLIMYTIFESAINIYATQMIQRRDLTFFESRRVLFAGFTYVVGPLIGGWAIYNGGIWIPIILSGICAISVPIVMYLLIPDVSKVRKSLNLNLPSHKDFFLFYKQPRLRLAWVLATARSSWWQVFGVYTPIFAVKAGYGYGAGGLIIAFASAMLLLAPFWQLFSRKHGLRLTYFYGYLACGIMTAVAGYLGTEHSAAAIGFLIGASLAMSAVDSGGNAIFLRAVHPHQRIRLIPIYNTFRDLAQIIPSLLFAVVLLYFELHVVFIVTGVLIVICSYYCLKVNRRL